eukprot:TRINITY_DN11938_c0_g1_i1.p1 TRINITY_DN11938_c0_g1~~TRINITY_DN11938_c0_g1_i1.p1  ORF type:complete len:1025 (+),score=275.90 TRINITY_DN11938_c0_g1_i1:200-3274(+)
MGGQLTKYLRDSSQSRKIALTHQHLTNSDIRQVARFLKDNEFCEELDLSNNNIGDKKLKHIARALQKNTRLKRLVLHYCHISDPGVQTIAEALQSNSTLRELDLSHNAVHDAGVCALSKMLKDAKGLEKLVLKYNFCGEKGGEAIASALITNKSLRTLDLENNQLGAAAAHALADALLQNNTLVELCLSSNQIGNAGAQAMADMLLSNVTLESILLGNNGFSEKLKQEIQENILARRDAQANVSDQKFRIADAKYEQDRENQRLLQAIKQGQIASVQIALPQLTGLKRHPLSSPTSLRPSMRDQLDAAMGLHDADRFVAITNSGHAPLSSRSLSDPRLRGDSSLFQSKRDWFHSVEAMEGLHAPHRFDSISPTEGIEPHDGSPKLLFTSEWFHSAVRNGARIAHDIADIQANASDSDSDGSYRRRKKYRHHRSGSVSSSDEPGRKEQRAKMSAVLKEYKSAYDVSDDDTDTSGGDGTLKKPSAVPGDKPARRARRPAPDGANEMAVKGSTKQKQFQRKAAPPAPGEAPATSALQKLNDAAAKRDGPPPPGATPARAGGPPPPPPPPPPEFLTGRPGRGGPPPPPMPGMFGMGPQLTHNGKKLKQFHWNKIPMNKLDDTFWGQSQLEELDLDEDELEEMFVVADNKTKIDTQEGVIHSLLDTRRANNIGITLSGIPLTHAEIREAVMSVDDSKLTLENVSSLLKICPSSDEADAISKFKGDMEDLTVADQFFAEMLTVPNLRVRLESFVFKLQFDQEVAFVREQMDVLDAACKELKASTRLTKLLEVILQVGNALNQTGHAGAARGFKLDSLLKITDTKGTTSKFTLLHYLIQLLHQRMPDLLDFYEDMPNVPRAAKINGKALKDEVTDLKTAFEALHEEVERVRADNVDGDLFASRMGEFAAHAKEQMDSLQHDMKNSTDRFETTARYFGEDPQFVKPETFFENLANFIGTFKAAAKEHLDRKRRQAVAEEKAAHRAANPPTPKQKPAAADASDTKMPPPPSRKPQPPSPRKLPPTPPVAAAAS